MPDGGGASSNETPFNSSRSESVSDSAAATELVDAFSLDAAGAPLPEEAKFLVLEAAIKGVGTEASMLEVQSELS